MIYIGIDPGQTGAIAFIDLEIDRVAIFDYEDPLALVNLIEDVYTLSTPAVMYLEKQHSRPQQGVKTTFLIGENFGEWQGIHKVLGILTGVSLHIITAQAWKKAMFAGAKREYMTRKGEQVIDQKKMSINLVRNLYPNAASKYVTRVRDHNRAEALLIAEYGRRIHK